MSPASLIYTGGTMVVLYEGGTAFKRFWNPNSALKFLEKQKEAA